MAHPPDRQGTCGPLVSNITLYDETKCNMGVASCNDEDLESLNAIYDCYARVNPCELGMELQFVSRQYACVFSGPVTQPCQAALTMAAIETD